MVYNPVIVIGLDGVDFGYLDKFRKKLNNINELSESGATAPCRSVHPPWTGSAWPSMYTGTNPGHHGVYDFWDYQNDYPSDASIVTRNDVRAPALWNYLTDSDLESIVFNVPVTHPAEKIKGRLVPGYLAPEKEEGYPPGIRQEISDALDESYSIYSEHETNVESSKKIDKYEELLDKRASAATYLLNNYEWNFAFIQVQKTDAVFHNSSSIGDFEQIYAAADRLVGRLRSVCQDDPNIIICSDHGIGPVTGYTVFINQLLAQYGYVKPTNEVDLPSLERHKQDMVDGGNTSPDCMSVDTLGRLIDILGIDPSSLYRLAKRAGVEGPVMRIIPDSLKRSLGQGVDWRNSMAYCRSESEQGIRINLEGRDPDGVVSETEYESVREGIINIMSNLRTPDGDLVFQFVCKRERMYTGPNVDQACDILFRTKEMNHPVSTKLYGDVFLPINNFNHKDTGIFIGSGPDINETVNIDTVALTDIAPIVMGLLEQPVPERMSGSIPDNLIKKETTRRPYENVEFMKSTNYSHNQTEVADRLRDLGYLG